MNNKHKHEYVYIIIILIFLLYPVSYLGFRMEHKLVYHDGCGKPGVYSPFGSHEYLEKIYFPLIVIEEIVQKIVRRY